MRPPRPARFSLRADGPGFLYAQVAAGSALLCGWLARELCSPAHRPAYRVGYRGLDFFWGEHRINYYILMHLNYFDSRAQGSAHKAALGAVLIAALLEASGHPGLSPGIHRRAGVAARFLAYAFAAVVAARVFGGSTAGDVPAIPARAYVLGAAAVLAFLATGRPALRAPRDLLAGATVALLLAGATLPGLGFRPDLAGWGYDAIHNFEYHYAMEVGPMDRLAAGQRPLGEVQSNYGLLTQALLGAFERHVRPLGVAAIIGIFQALNVAYLLAATEVLRRWSRGAWVMVLVALLPVVPWYVYDHECLLFPNQSGWRTLAFPLTFLALWAVRRRPAPAAALRLGLAGGVFLLINPESGVAAAAGSWAYLALRHRPRDGLGAARLLGVGGAWYACGVAASFAAFAAACRALLGAWPDPAGLRWLLENSAFISSTGFSGTPYGGDPMAMLLFWHAAAVLILCARPGPHADGFARGVRACAATIILVWLAYYANRAVCWNLSSFYFVYGLLVIDALRLVLAKVGRRGVIDGSVVATTLALALVFLPNVWRVHGYNARHHKRLGGEPTAPQRAGARRLSGLLFPEPFARAIEERAAYVRGLGRGRRVVYLSPDAYLIAKVSGTPPAIPANDLLLDSYNEPRYRRIVAHLLGCGAPSILVDSAAAPHPGLPRYLEFYNRLRESIAPAYRRTGLVSGWEVWEARGPGDSRPPP